jgi:hypothetical protein
MPVHDHRFLLATALLAACGSKAPTHDDAPLGSDAKDAMTMQSTRLTGTLYGSPFVLQYAALKRGTVSDPRNWLCVADIPVTNDTCAQQGSAERVMFLGPFLYDQNGTPGWVLAQVWLYHVGTSYSKAASSGTLDIAVDDESSGALQLTLNVSFDETSATTGTVAIGP